MKKCACEERGNRRLLNRIQRDFLTHLLNNYNGSSSSIEEEKEKLLDCESVFHSRAHLYRENIQTLLSTHVVLLSFPHTHTQLMYFFDSELPPDRQPCLKTPETQRKNIKNIKKRKK